MYSSNPLLCATYLINDNVRNVAGEDLGKIEDIVINVETGQIQYAILSFGGFMGIGNRHFALPWELLGVEWLEKHIIILDVDKELLKNAPKFNKDNPPNFEDPQFKSEIYEYYNLSIKHEVTTNHKKHSYGAGL